MEDLPYPDVSGAILRARVLKRIIIQKMKTESQSPAFLVAFPQYVQMQCVPVICTSPAKLYFTFRAMVNSITSNCEPKKKKNPSPKLFCQLYGQNNTRQLSYFLLCCTSRDTLSTIPPFLKSTGGRGLDLFYLPLKQYPLSN